VLSIRGIHLDGSVDESRRRRDASEVS
jgi:hypothetical protein